MEKLWSPWRSQYIESFKDTKDDEACIFCEAANTGAEDKDSLIVYNNKKSFTVLNLFPYNSGHLMVVPCRHISELLELTEEESLEIMQMIKLSMKALNLIMKPHGFNVGMNIGKAAGAGIDSHIHFHILPRWNGDTNFMPALGEVKVISQDLYNTKGKLIEAYSKILEEE